MNYSFVRSFIRSFEIVLSFIRSFIHSFVRSFLHLHWRASQVHRPLWQDRWVELFGHRVNLQVSTWLHLSAMAKAITYQPYLSIHYSSIFSNYPSIGFFFKIRTLNTSKNITSFLKFKTNLAARLCDDQYKYSLSCVSLYFQLLSISPIFVKNNKFCFSHLNVNSFTR